MAYVDVQKCFLFQDNFSRLTSLDVAKRFEDCIYVYGGIPYECKNSNMY